MTDRKNFQGHVTGSCYLLSPDAKKLLFVYNKNLKKFLQPGGHCEEKDNTPFNGAIRELEEETNIKQSAYDVLDSTPIDINTHPVPENTKKQEKEHQHHDFAYLLKLKETVEITLNLNEVEEYIWVDLEDKNIVSLNIHNKIKKVL